jgi:hypothetical protein
MAQGAGIGDWFRQKMRKQLPPPPPPSDYRTGNSIMPNQGSVNSVQSPVYATLKQLPHGPYPARRPGSNETVYATIANRFRNDAGKMYPKTPRPQNMGYGGKSRRPAGKSRRAKSRRAN